MGRSPADLVIFILGRLLQLVPTILGVIVITFIFSRVSISDPCAAWNPHAKPSVLAACQQYFGTNLPLYQQFFRYLEGLFIGNWGTDPNNGVLVLPLLLETFPATLELVLASLVIMIVVGIILGVVAAAGSGRWPDHAVRLFYLSGWAAPTYLVALIFAIAIAPAFGLPTGGEYSVTPPPFPQITYMSVLDAMIAGNLPYTIDAIQHLVLPATALAFLNLGIITRMTRGSMLEVLPLDYVKTARMKGLQNSTVLLRHALRNSLISTVTVLGFTASGLLASTVVVEAIFHWPGIGLYAYNAVITYNFAGVIGVTIFFAFAVVIANLLADITYGILDPRVDWR